jgi:uncharacterized membrane protein YiaA
LRGYVGAVMVIAGMIVALSQRTADALGDRPIDLEEAA